MRKLTVASTICGIISPVLMVTLWAVASLLRPNYDQLTQKGSELGTGPDSIVMNANFMMTGILIVAFALGLSRSIHDGKWLKIGRALLSICGILEAATGMFPCDPGCPSSLGSFSQNIHLGIALAFFSSIAFTPLIFGMGLDRDRFWQAYRAYSVVTGLASVGLGSGFSLTVLYLPQFAGLFERLFLAFPFLWIELMAIHALRAQNQNRTALQDA